MQWTTVGDVLANLDPKHRQRSRQLALNHWIGQAKLEQEERFNIEKLNIEHNKLDLERNKLGIEYDRLGLEREKIQNTLQSQAEQRAFEREQNELYNNAIIEREHLSGKNALKLANNQFMLDQLKSSSDLINRMFESQLKQEEDKNQTRLDTMKQMILAKQNQKLQEKIIEADTKRQIAVIQADTQRQISLMEKDLEVKSKIQELEIKHEKEKMFLNFNYTNIAKFIENHIADMRITFDQELYLIMELVKRTLGLGEQVVTDEQMKFWADSIAEDLRHNAR